LITVERCLWSRKLRPDGDSVLVDVSADDALTFTRREGAPLQTAEVPVAA
jgi:hypothetical protein